MTNDEAPLLPPGGERCAAASADVGEEIAGTAPGDADWLVVEHPGPWGRKAVTESRLPDDVVAHLKASSARVQLVRRHGGRDGPSARTGLRVFTASLPAAGGPADVRTALVDDLRDLPDLAPTDLTSYDGLLWLVCTNGRRDLCCAERGRPVASALAARWPEETWETTHLGGHRFAGTLLALPSGHTLGRVDARTAVEACAELASGRVPVAASRGRAGWPASVQYADLRLRAAHGWSGLDDVGLVDRLRVERGSADTVTLDTPDGPRTVSVTATPGEPRRQSCGDTSTKTAPVLAMRDAAPYS